jgi:hypothetical protein
MVPNRESFGTSPSPSSGWARNQTSSKPTRANDGRAPVEAVQKPSTVGVAFLLVAFLQEISIQEEFRLERFRNLLHLRNRLPPLRLQAKSESISLLRLNYDPLDFIAGAPLPAGRRSSYTP